MQVVHADCLAYMPTMPPDSVHCVVSSPPYFGLRDYQTGSWVGGDPDCDHCKGNPAKSVSSSGLNHPESTGTGHRHEGYRSICRKRGAKRVDQQIGLEEAPEEYVEKLVQVFREVRRVLRPDGTLWLVLGDTYGNSKNLIGMPWRVALALQTEGWVLRNAIAWVKDACMPESVKDRLTSSHEYVFMFAKQRRYYFDGEAIRERGVSDGKPGDQRDTRDIHGLGIGNTGLNAAKRRLQAEYEANGFITRNCRDVWRINPRPYNGAHFATFPIELAERCIKAGTSEHGCCANCGAPWKRLQQRTSADGRTSVVTAQDRYARDSEDNHLSHNHSIEKTSSGRGRRGAFSGAIVLDTKEMGWASSCNCEAPVVPCTVLDLFAGSGTTGEAALTLGRDVTLIELNPDYVKMIERRLTVFTPHTAFSFAAD